VNQTSADSEIGYDSVSWDNALVPQALHTSSSPQSASETFQKPDDRGCQSPMGKRKGTAVSIPCPTPMNQADGRQRRRQCWPSKEVGKRKGMVSADSRGRTVMARPVAFRTAGPPVRLSHPRACATPSRPPSAHPAR
jgi:hypothetical protein